MEMGMKILLVVSFWGCIFLSGCFRGDYIKVDYYTIHTEPMATSSIKLPCTIGIRTFTAVQRYKDLIIYRPSPYRLEYLEHSRWVEMPSEMATSAFLQCLRQSNLFTAVSMAPNIRSKGLILDGELLRFEVAREEGHDYVVCSIFLEIRTNDEEHLLWYRELSAKVPCDLNNKESIASNMSKAVTQIALELVERLSKDREFQQQASRDKKTTGDAVR